MRGKAAKILELEESVDFWRTRSNSFEELAKDMCNNMYAEFPSHWITEFDKLINPPDPTLVEEGAIDEDEEREMGDEL